MEFIFLGYDTNLALPLDRDAKMKSLEQETCTATARDSLNIQRVQVQLECLDRLIHEAA
ncbi:MAG: hypothetical protein NVSMB27_47270 [Ktedonobacteraceae bacterium]